MFGTLDPASISKIIDIMEFVVKDVGAVICCEGDPANILYLIISGECSVEINGKQISTLRPSDLFGEAALFPSAANGIAIRTATVSVVNGSVELLSLSKEQFDDLRVSKILNDDCLSKLKNIANHRAKVDEEKTRR